SFEEEEIASGSIPVVRLCRLLIEALRPAAAGKVLKNCASKIFFAKSLVTAEKAGKALEFSKSFTAKKVDGTTALEQWVR
ncbi:hypothetical protein HW132_35755, partial [Brasilonema sp. CT11]|nr:hypothetical protein [Brasilonema sp. CT11]